ncbi:MAG: signal peptidase I [Planctomycetota bacterium]|jgi:signal peptidase I
MSTDKSKKDKSRSKEPCGKDRAAEIANTFEWLITAFILAFVFRAFVMEAYRIPTGSMADTLMGAHFRLCCRQCGYKYKHGFNPQNYGLPQDTLPRGTIPSFPSRCPSCGYYQPTGGTMPVSNGDRILVLKCIYQFAEPKRWDVIVFKNPLDPPINYIKRLVGLPGETVEIIDGDVYINGQISRKPAKVQRELWMPVYDNDYQPVRPTEGLFNGHLWEQPFDVAGSKWEIDKNNPTVFRLNSSPDEISYLSYDMSVGNDFRATYAYDDTAKYDYMPYCSDLMTRFCVSLSGQKGRVGIAMSKYETQYQAWVDFTGDMVITKTSQNGVPVYLAQKSIEPPAAERPVPVEFASVDHQLIFQFEKEELTYDLGSGPEDAGRRETEIMPEVKIFAAGNVALSHVALFRDIHYTGKQFASGREVSRALEGNPLKLEDDNFFVLGDNSPDSYDGRWWSEPGKRNNNLFYRKGIVPRDYLVGKALFVYWPGGFKPFSRSRFSLVPNVGQLRFIYGGSSKE